MLEILFNDSACGSLKAAKSVGESNYFGGCVGVIVTRDDGKKPKRAEIKAAQKAAEEKARLDWENAVPIEVNSGDIFCLNLNLSVGDISETQLGSLRLNALKKMFSIYPNERNEVANQLFTSAVSSLETVRQRAQLGEELRIWYSDQPDEMCGLYWLMAQLEQWGITQINASVVKLPQWEQNGDIIVHKTCWGAVAPHEWHRYVGLQQQVPKSFITSCALQWRQLQEENSPLRTLLCGRLVSVAENIYDDFILREIEKEETEFFEANVVGRVLGKYELGIGDAWIAWRIEEMIKNGSLQAVTAVSKDNPIYHKTLRKM